MHPVVERVEDAGVRAGAVGVGAHDLAVRVGQASGGDPDAPGAGRGGVGGGGGPGGAGEVGVRSGGVAGGPAGADALPRRYGLSGVDGQALGVAVGGGDAVRVLDLDLETAAGSEGSAVGTDLA